MSWFWANAHFDHKVLATLETWTLQYVVLQPFLCLLHILGHDLLHDNPLLGRVVFAVFLASTTISMSALIGFFHTFEEEIARHQPLKKLLCIKAIVGVCSYQYIGLSRLLPTVSAYLPEGDVIGDLAVCYEMGLLFAGAFYWSYRPAAAPAEKAPKKKKA